MPAIRSFRDLVVYRAAKNEALRIYRFSKTFPVAERYSMTDQVRRSSRAVSAMIAEAWSRRSYPAAFRHKLTEALGEAMETQAWLDHAVACDYISEKDFASSDVAWQSIGAMLNKMIQRTSDFCSA